MWYFIHRDLYGVPGAVAKLMGASDRSAATAGEYMLVPCLYAAAASADHAGRFVCNGGETQSGAQLTILSGLANMVLDYVFIAVFGWGLRARHGRLRLDIP